jgi:hypothetical protein
VGRTNRQQTEERIAWLKSQMTNPGLPENLRDEFRRTIENLERRIQEWLNDGTIDETKNDQNAVPENTNKRSKKKRHLPKHKVSTVSST